MLKTGASVAVLTLLLGATAAVSQTTMPPQRPAPPAPSRTEVPKAPVAGQIVVQDANTVLAKELIGQTVYASDKAKIGSISDLILSKDAKTVEGFVIGVGGFLGIGEKSVAMKLDRLQITHGTTVVAVRYADGVVMAGDRRATSGNLISHRTME